MSYFNPYLLRKRAFFNPQLLRKVAFDDPTTPMGFMKQQMDEDLAEDQRADKRQELFRQQKQQRRNYIQRNTRVQPGGTPTNYGFKDPNTINAGIKASKDFLDPYYQKGSLDRQDSQLQVNYPHNPNVSPGWHTLTNETVPSWNIARNIWKNLRQGNLTNKQFLNMSAGRDDYYDLYKQHLNKLPTKAFTDSGVYKLPDAEMDSFANSPVTQPKFVPSNQPNAYYNPSEHGSIVIEQSNNSGVFDPNKLRYIPSGDSILRSLPITQNTSAWNGNFYKHENTHRGDMGTNVAGIRMDPSMGESYQNYFPNLHPAVDPYRAIVSGNGGWTIPIYEGTFSASDPGTQYRLGKHEPAQAEMMLPSAAVNPNGTLNVEKLKDYKGFDPSVVADPGFTMEQISQLSNNGRDAAGRPLGANAYAFSAEEIRQGLRALNQGQSAVQQAIKRNPQAFLNAGATQEELNEYLNLPLFPDELENVDQRMEFYAKHPLFKQFLGNENARAIDRYFWTIGESQNEEQSPEYRDAFKRIGNFMRANGITMANNRNMNPVRSGMAQYMVNTFGQAPRVIG